MSSTTLVNEAELFISQRLYGRQSSEHRKRCFQLGLQSPLWVWTHHGGDAPSTHTNKRSNTTLPMEIIQAVHAMEWIVFQQSHAHIAVVVQPSWVEATTAEVMKRIQASHPHVVVKVLPHEHFDGPQPPSSSSSSSPSTEYITFDVVLYALGVAADAAAMAAASPHDVRISHVLRATHVSCVVLADAAWCASSTSSALPPSWAMWKRFVAKLATEQLPISYTNNNNSSTPKDDACLASMVGMCLPLCCGEHPDQRQLVDGHQPIPSCCPHWCLKGFNCHDARHVCAGMCHPGHVHATCIYPCRRMMPCGHPCLMRCGQRCDCLQVVEHTMSCHHEVVLGINKESMEPIYGRVQHVYRGVCANAALPCSVEYATECGRCLGPTTTTCCEATQQQHSLSNRTIVCATCKRVEREVRSQVLAEVLCSAEVEKKKLKTELQRTLHQQRKAAAQGLFLPGSKVEVIDALRCVAPIVADEDFPGLVFMDMNDPSFFQRVEGACGIYVSSHVDVMDSSEIRNLVRLFSGEHVLVVDGGLRLIRALTSGVVAPKPLLITGGPPQNGSNTNNTHGATTGKEFALAQSMVSGTYYLTQPVACGSPSRGGAIEEMPELEMLANVIVSVVAIDPTDAEKVSVRCRLARVVLHHDAEQGVPLANTGKRERPEDVAAPATTTTTTTTSAAAHVAVADRVACVEVCFTFIAPIAALEPLTGFSRGGYIFVSAPERQVKKALELQQVEAAYATMRADADGASIRDDDSACLRLTAAPVDGDTPYVLVELMNPPVEQLHLGPIALLKRRTLAAVMSGATPRRGRGHGAPSSTTTTTTNNINNTSSVVLMAAVPFLFTLPDELAEAEKALDAAAQRRFNDRVEAVLATRVDEMAARNDEDAYHQQQQMPAVSAASMAQVRQAYSIPVPLPTAEVVAAARTNTIHEPLSSDQASLRRMKNKILARRATMECASWLGDAQRLVAEGAEADALYLKSIFVRLHSRSK